MHQVVQNIRTGKLSIQRIPAPTVRPGYVLIENLCSLISAGTERSAMELAQKSLLGKARERPDQVRRVLEKLRNEGILNTLQQVAEKLEEPMPMGYNSAGRVIACGPGVSEFKTGELAASNGPHAGVVCVPKHLCARIPPGVELEQAAFAVLGAIALQGIRLAHLGLRDNVFVIGLGLIGQITTALLRAAGCRVIGTDLDGQKCQLALKMGAAAAAPAMTARDVLQLTGGLGADAVVITASTKGNEPIELAAEAVRQKGRVVAIGAVGLNLPRRPFYFKEAEFVVSCSYGPGRYDENYEDRGRDYPAAHVRWTEQRNLQAVLDLLGSRQIDFGPLITHRFPIRDGERAYDLIQSGREPYLGIILDYRAEQIENRRRRIELRAARAPGGIGAGVLGAGNFARMVLLPALKKTGGMRPRVLCSAGGLSSAAAGERLGFETVTTDEAEVFKDSQVGAVFIITRHDQHARQVIEALRHGKHVFAEKPLALTLDELAGIEDALAAATGTAPILMVGFNRRFAPATALVKDFFARTKAPLTVAIRFNAGEIPPSHWTQDAETGGGRIIGEACHAIDLATHLTGSPPVRVYAEAIGGGQTPVTDDQCFITLRHENGSISSIGYLAGGDKAFPKERVEVFGGGQVAVIDDFREVTTVRGGKTTRHRKWSQDKGHRAEVDAFIRALGTGGDAPISWADLRAVTAASILAVQSLREGIPFDF